jgi:hypothetical protein
MTLREQTAWERPKVLRKNRPQEPQSRVEHAPRHTTTQSQSRTPVPILPDDEDEVYTQARMPVVTRKYNHYPVPPPTHVTEETGQFRTTPTWFLLIAVGIILLAFVLAFLIIVFVIPSYNKWNDDRNYGYPRTTHMKAVVGHGTTADPYSFFTAENLNGYVFIWEITPSSDPTTTHVYYIAQFSGANNDLIPISSITFQDMNGDGKPDMLVTMGNGSTYVLYNTGKEFVQQNPVKK